MAVLARMTDLPDDLLWVARDRASEEPVCTPEAHRLEIDRHGAELHALIRVAMAGPEGQERRRTEREIVEAVIDDASEEALQALEALIERRRRVAT